MCCKNYQKKIGFGILVVVMLKNINQVYHFNGILMITQTKINGMKYTFFQGNVFIYNLSVSGSVNCIKYLILNTENMNDWVRRRVAFIYCRKGMNYSTLRCQCKYRDRIYQLSKRINEVLFDDDSRNTNCWFNKNQHKINIMSILTQFNHEPFGIIHKEIPFSTLHILIWFKIIEFINYVKSNFSWRF